MVNGLATRRFKPLSHLSRWRPQRDSNPRLSELATPVGFEPTSSIYGIRIRSPGRYGAKILIPMLYAMTIRAKQVALI